MKFKAWLAVLAVSLMSIAGTAGAVTVAVDAFANSSTGGTGAFALNLTAGEEFSVTVPTSGAGSLWNAGALPRWSTADGITGNLYYGPGSDPQVQTWASSQGVTINNGDLIGANNFGQWTQGGLTAPFGALVGEIGNSGQYFLIGSNYTGTASATGALNLFFFDENQSDNFGTIQATVNAVPLPGSLGLMLLGVGGFGTAALRRRFLAR